MTLTIFSCGSSQPLRLVDFSAFLEQQRLDPETVSTCQQIQLPFLQNVDTLFDFSRLSLQYHKHLFVHIGANSNLADPNLEVSKSLYPRSCINLKRYKSFAKFQLIAIRGKITFFLFPVL